MSNVTELARRLNQIGKNAATETRVETGTVESTAPLTISILGGEILAAAPLLSMTATAAARVWDTGDLAAVLLSRSGVLLLDRLVRG